MFGKALFMYEWGNRAMHAAIDKSSRYASVS